MLTDLSGPFADTGAAMRAGHRLWVADVNAAGGVCGRQIRLAVADHGSKPDRARSEFARISPAAAGLLSVLSAPVIEALRGPIARSGLTAVAASGRSELLRDPGLVVVGATHDLEVVGGLSYLLERGRIAAGDTIGHVHAAGEYGANALLGAAYFARRQGMELVEARVAPGETDLRQVVARFRRAGVDVIVSSARPSQTASAARHNAALGLDAELLANGAAFSPVLLDSPRSARALRAAIVVASAIPYSAPGRAAEIAARFERAKSGVRPSSAVQQGYAFGLVWQHVLAAACASGDLGREGVRAALAASADVDTGGLVPALDFSSPGSPSARAVYLAVPERGVPGGLRQVGGPFTAADAAAYRPPRD